VLEEYACGGAVMQMFGGTKVTFFQKVTSFPPLSLRSARQCISTVCNPREKANAFSLKFLPRFFKKQA